MDSFRVYLMVGLLGSGKSTWAKQKVFYEPDTVIVDRAVMKNMLLGIYSYGPSEVASMVKCLARDAVRYAAEDGLNVVIDEPNLTVRDRSEWLEFVAMVAKDAKRELFLQVVYCAESDGNVGYRCQGGLRGLSVYRWTDVLKGMKERFESVSDDEFPSGTYFEVVRMDER